MDVFLKSDSTKELKELKMASDKFAPVKRLGKPPEELK